MNKIRLRFAPSPTGYLHIGSLRTVLFDYLIAKSLDGDLILRIEDTDQKREVPSAVDKLIKILNWLGIKFDEGPGLIRAATNGAHTNVNKDVGKFGPYVQSQRLEIYKKYSDELLKKDGAYLCFCSEERLKKIREEQQAEKLPPRYDRACRDLTKSQIDKKIKSKEKFVIRQKMPLSSEVIVHDELRGDIKFMAENLDDHILLKSNGIPTYQFAVVIDDYLMKISHVLRGDEWLPSFPKNILLYQAFGWQAPKFIHLPLTLNKNGGKLSKRHGDVAVENYKAKGYLPEALLNFSVLLGWHPVDDKEILSLDEMVKKFKIKDMGTSPAIFDIEKLDYFNGWYIRQKPIDELVESCIPFLVEAKEESGIRNQESGIKDKYVINGKEFSFEYIKKVVALEQERLKKLSEIGELTEFFFTDKLEYKTELLIWKKMTLEQVKNNLGQIYQQLEKIPRENWTNDSIEDAIMSYIRAKNMKVGDMLWPMRAALTGREASPGPFEVAEVLGKEKSLERIKEGTEKL